MTSMLYFGRGFRKVQRESSTQIIVQPQFDSMEAAHWLQETIESLYKIPAALKSVDVKTLRAPCVDMPWTSAHAPVSHWRCAPA